MQIGKRIYYDIATGNVLIDAGERQGSVRPTTVEQDIEVYKNLSERNRGSFDYVELEYGQYAQDFEECSGYRVNPETKQIEFSYLDPNETEPSEPVYQAPLSEEVNGLKQENSLLKSKVDALASHNELMEGALIELTSMILG